MLQRSDTDSFPFLRSRLVLVKRVQIVRGHVKKVSIVELDNGYAVCRLKNFRMLYWIMDANDKRYVNRMYRRMHAQTKFSIEYTSVGLAHARPINLSYYIFYVNKKCGRKHLPHSLLQTKECIMRITLHRQVH